MRFVSCIEATGTGSKPATSISSMPANHVPFSRVQKAARALQPIPASSFSRSGVVAFAKGKLGDDLLDFVTAGPKMRKWYGQAERPTEADEEDIQGTEQPGPDEDEDDQGDGDAVLVTDAETPIGEQVILQLILARAEVRVLVKDVAAARNAYGPYVTPLSIDTGNAAMLQRALKGCGSVVCLGRPGALLKVARAAGVAHVVMVSGAGAQQGGFFSGLFDRELSDLRDASREAALAASGGQRYTVVRVAAVSDAPGGGSSIRLVALEGLGAPSQAAPPVSREDLAAVVVQALVRPPRSSRVFQVVTSSPGAPPTTAEWGALFDVVTPSEAAAA